MKRLLCLLICLLILTGCAGGQRVDLMPTASPDTSALALYIYDGETITRQFLFETAQVKEVLQDFREANAEPVEVDVTTLQPPYYGLEIGSTEIGSERGLWADGFFITDDGSAYKMDYEFEQLLAEYPWSNLDEFQSLTVMPCASHMAKTEAGWNKNFLTLAAEEAAPDGISVEITKQEEEEIVVRFRNQSGVEWGFGHAFTLQVLLDDSWYMVPPAEEVAFTEELLIVPAGDEREETYSLWFYGDLPAGIYRLVTDGGLWVEFEIE